MGIIKNNFIEALKNTDGLIRQKTIANLSKQLSKSIEIVMRACDSLYEKNYSLFLTGSLAICLRSNSLKEFRISGDKSDVDLWIIITNSPNKSLKLSSLEKKIINGFSRLAHFDIVCVPFARNDLKVSLKIMSNETTKKILQFNKINLSVFRRNSLKKIKTENIFYGIKSIHRIPIIEKELKDGGFLWHWTTNPFVEKDFVLTDIHSCFLIGGFLTDGLKLERARDLFLKKFFYHFKKCQEKIATDNPFKILRYFYDRFPSSSTKIFGK